MDKKISPYEPRKAKRSVKFDLPCTNNFQSNGWSQHRQRSPSPEMNVSTASSSSNSSPNEEVLDLTVKTIKVKVAGELARSCGIEPRTLSFSPSSSSSSSQEESEKSDENGRDADDEGEGEDASLFCEEEGAARAAPWAPKKRRSMQRVRTAGGAASASSLAEELESLALHGSGQKRVPKRKVRWQDKDSSDETMAPQTKRRLYDREGGQISEEDLIDIDFL